MADVGRAIGDLCRTHRDLRKGGRRGYQSGSGDIHPHHNRAGEFRNSSFATGQFRAPGDIATRTWTFLILSGLATGASWLCYFRALKLGPATLVAPIDKLSVVLVALFAFVFLGERPSATGWLGIALIASGAVLLAIKK